MSYFNSKINLNPKLLIDLGKEFLDRNLLDEALEIFSKFKKGESFYTDALCGLIKANSLMGNSLEVIRLGEELLDDGLDDRRNLYFSSMIAGAYSKIGKFSNALPFLMKGLALFPDNERIQKWILELPKGAIRLNIKPLIREAKATKQFGLTPHFIFDCITPLLWGARSTTCCFADQFPFPFQFSIDEIKGLWAMLATYLYSVFGIYMAFYKYFAIKDQECEPIGKIYFSLKDTIFEEVSEIERMAFEEFENRGKVSAPQNPQLIEGVPLNSMIKEGILLGYPNCCIDWAVNMRKNKESIEKQALVSLITEEFVSSFEESNPSPPEFAYFTSEFFPCDPRCRNAENIGMAIYRQYDKNDKNLSGFFKNNFLQINKARIFNPSAKLNDLTVDFNCELLNASQTSWRKLCFFFKKYFFGKIGSAIR